MEAGTFLKSSQRAAIAPARPPAARLGVAQDDYLTDGTRLLRCLSVDGSPHPFASALFEDCMTLEVVIIPTTELSAEGLRTVRR
jgi:hypothetical protein